MTRPSRRDVERALEDLESDDGEDVTLARDVSAEFVTYMAEECTEGAEAAYVVVDAEGEVVESPGDEPVEVPTAGRDDEADEADEGDGDADAGE